jgi:hypothetical protein
MLQFENIFIDVSAADAAMNFHLHVVTEGQAHFLSLLRQFSCRGEDEYLGFPESRVDGLECTHRENTCLTRSTLTLDDDISFLSDRQYCALLNRTGLVKTVS